MDQSRRFLVTMTLMMLFWGAWFGFIQPRFFPPPVPVVPREPIAAGEQQLRAAEVAEAHPDWQPPNHPERTVLLGSLDPASNYFQQVTVTSRGAAVETVALNDPRYRDLGNRKSALNILAPVKDAAKTLQTTVAEIDEQLLAFKTDTGTLNWKLEQTLPDPANPKLNRGAIFSLASPDGTLELVKTYSLRTVKNAQTPEVRENASDGYMIDLTVSLRNTGDDARSVGYTLQGPVGLPLENEEHTSFYRNLELGFYDPDGELDASTLTSSDATEQATLVRKADEARADADAAEKKVERLKRRIAELEKTVQDEPDNKQAPVDLRVLRSDLAAAEKTATEYAEAALVAERDSEEWKSPFLYLGVEVQYFAALLLPDDDRPIAARFQKPRVKVAVPELITEAENANYNDISFAVTTEPVELPPGGEVSQKWSLYAGPKRGSLLAPLGAGEVLDQGRFLWWSNVGWVAAISQGMLWILGNIHSVGIPYGIAIICLTVIVRGCMFPISRKQAISAAKMKELQPKINELKAKFGDDREGLARAQMEMFARHGYNPLAGCLPVFLQLPIFIGLYNALQSSVDLRMAEFLWIDNLAAPDQLFRMPFALPFLGSDFNLLPLITVVLFYIQQKLFMPPATTPEQEMQFKVMNFMMIFMGFFFYHVPAGLCVYFIASSTWSIAERKLLQNTKAAHITPAEAAEADREVQELSPKKPGKPKPQTVTQILNDPNRKKTWLEKLMEKADDARKQAEQGREANNNKGGGKPNGPPNPSGKPHGPKNRSRR